MWKSEHFVEIVFKKKKNRNVFEHNDFSMPYSPPETFLEILPPLSSFFTPQTETFSEAEKDFLFLVNVRKRHS